MDKFEEKLEYFHECEDEQIARQRAKLAYALKCRDYEEAAKYRDEHKQGYCPHCFIYSPLTITATAVATLRRPVNERVKAPAHPAHPVCSAHSSKLSSSCRYNNSFLKFIADLQ